MNTEEGRSFMGMIKAFLVEIVGGGSNNPKIPHDPIIVITAKKGATAHDAVRAFATEEDICLDRVVAGGIDKASGNISGYNVSVRATLVKIITC